MSSFFRRLFQLLLGVAFFFAPFSAGQTGPQLEGNSDPTYQQLRSIGLAGEMVTVHGKVTGAVFVGEGEMTLDPPLEMERRSLKMLTKSDEFDEQFNHLVLRFTDSTYEEIKKAGAASQTPCDAGLLRDSQNAMRHNINYNLDARILEDVLKPGPGGLFVAFIHGKHYDNKLLYIVDPNGAPDVAPEEVELMSYGDEKSGVWTAFPMSSDYRAVLGAGAEKTAKVHIEQQDLDTTIEGSARLDGKAATTFVALTAGSRVYPFDLFGTLRVQSVTGQDGHPLEFIQEDKSDDPDFYVILPQALSAGEKYTLTTTYSGKGAVENTGNGNYYPIARGDWYPADAGASLGDYSNFDMTFRIPKGMKMAASGSLVSEKEEGGRSVTVWKSDAPEPMAGFQFGRMKEVDAQLRNPDFLVAAYANEEPPDWAAPLQGGTMGNLSTVSMMKVPLVEAKYAIQLYTDYFGPLPYKRLSMTQQTACTYG